MPLSDTCGCPRRCPLPEGPGGAASRRLLGNGQVLPIISLFPGEGPRAGWVAAGGPACWGQWPGREGAGSSLGGPWAGLHPFPPSPRGGPGADMLTAQVKSVLARHQVFQKATEETVREYKGRGEEVFSD